MTGPSPSVESLKAILGETQWFMDALLAARRVGAPDWLIGAGALRTAVWDRLHRHRERTPISDIDLVFFDPVDTSPERERSVEDALRDELPCIPWEATNQARVHLWFPREFGSDVEPFASTAEAIATWPETATAVGVRLTDDHDLLVVAPFGLDDLLGMVYRRNPARVTIEEFERRLVTKRIAERWPKARIVR